MRWAFGFGALAGALLLQPARAAAQPPPLAPTAMPDVYVPQLRYKTHSPALIGGGVTLLAFAGLSIAGASTAMLIDLRGNGDDFRGVLSAVVGIPLFIHAAGCIAGGIPMIVIGSRQIPAGYAGSRAVPSISVGPTTTLRWTF